MRIYYNNGVSPHRLKYTRKELAIKANKANMRTVFWMSSITPGCHWHPREHLLICVVSSPLLQKLCLLLYSFRYTPFSSSSSFFLSPSAVSSDSLPSSCISGASPFPPLQTVLSSCFWRLPVPPSCMAQISMGDQLK